MSSNHPNVSLIVKYSYPLNSGLDFTNLITIPPDIIFRPNILIRILRTLIQRRHMLPMLPMLRPQIVSVDAGDNQAGDCDAEVW